MSFATFLAKVSGKNRFWLYRIELGATRVFYTSRATQYEQHNFDVFDMADVFDQVDVFTRVWSPVPIKQGRIRRTSHIKRAELDLVLPRTNAIAQQFRDGLEAQASKLQILTGFANDPDAEVVTKFLGRVVGVKPGIVSITLTAENLFTALRRKALAQNMQRLCGHAQYHDPGPDYAGCKLVLADWQTIATATAVSGDVLTVTEAANFDDGYFSGGILEYGSDRRFILKHAGAELTLLSLPAGIATAVSGGSVAVKIAPGCNLTFQMCSAVFQNTDNFGAFPFMSSNPFDGRNPF